MSRDALLVTHTGRRDMRRPRPAQVSELTAVGRLRGPGARGRGGRARRHRRRGGAAGRRRPRPAARWCWCSAATARSCARPSWPGPAGPPLLGVNLGRVGFLAETEPEALPDAVAARRRAQLHGGGAAHPRRRRPGRRAAWSPGRGRSTRRRSRRARGSGCSRWSSRSTAGRCRATAATAWCARRRPARPRTRSRPAGRSSGRRCEALLVVPNARTRCSPGRW